MAVTRRFLIVGWKVKTGGGEVILRNYLSFLNDNPDDCSYVALVHDKALYEPVACPRVRLGSAGAAAADQPRRAVDVSCRPATLVESVAH